MPRLRPKIPKLQPGNLDRIIGGYVLQKLERDPMRSVLETAVALAMPDHVRRSFLANRQSRGIPELTRVFTTHVEHFTRTVADGLGRPGPDLILAAVDRPCVA